MAISSTFSLILATGLAFGLFWVALSVGSAQRMHWLLSAWVVLAGALIGARVGFVLGHLPYFSTHAAEIASFWLGGLTWEGALAGGLLVLPLAALLWKWPFLPVLDRLSRLLFPAAIACWAGLWSIGLGYGQELQGNYWWGLLTGDEGGKISLHLPVQPVAIVSLLVFFIALEVLLRHSELPGLRGLSSLTLLSAHTLLFSFLRADPAPAWLAMRVETWLAMGYTCLGLFFLIRLWVITRHPFHQIKLHFKKTESKAL